MQSIKVISNFKLKSERKTCKKVRLLPSAATVAWYTEVWMYLGRFVNHGNRQRASLIYFIKYLTYLHLGQIDQAFIWLLYRFRFFSSFLTSVR